MLKANSMHFRRCHVCGTLCCSKTGQVEKCTSCHKPLPKFYYFDDRLTFVYSEHRLRPKQEMHSYTPIYGLTAYWESF